MLNLGGVTSYFDLYDRYSTLMDGIGFGEMITLLTYALGIGIYSVVGNYMGLVMWLNIDALEDKKTHKNKITKIQGYKYLAVGIIIAAGGIIAALGFGEQSVKLLSIYDNYSGFADASSYFIDFTLHEIESLANLIVLSTLGAGGYIVGIFILGQELNFSDAVA
jgi:hypothetical protein